MNSGAQVTETLRTILEEETAELAKETGFIRRQRQLSGADFAQTLIFGWLQDPQVSLDGLTQIAGRREVTISASGLCQRFTEEAARFLQRVFERLTQVRLQAEAAPLALLERFRAVIVEESTQISLPEDLAELWPGTGQQGRLKLFVRWDVLRGELAGPLLTPGRQVDAMSPLREQEVPEGSLYLADQAFFEQGRLRQWHQRHRGQRRYYLLRLPVGTGLYTRSGHRLVLAGLLPQQEGSVVELGVLVGSTARGSARLIVSRVPQEVAEQRRERLRAEAHDRGREPSEQALYLAGWLIVVSNVPRRLLSLAQTLVVLEVALAHRGAVPAVQRGRLDEWRSSKRWRIVCELYAKLAAMVIQHWLITLGCWHDPQRSLVKAAQVVRREAGQLMVELYERRVEQAVRRIVRCMGSGCRMNTRQQ